MDAEGNGLTLEGLAQRLETLECDNERMHSENAELHRKLALQEGSGTSGAEEGAPPFYGPESMGLAQRQEMLERENASLRRELATVAANLTQQASGDKPSFTPPDGIFRDVYCKSLYGTDYRNNSPIVRIYNSGTNRP
jgi:hypothetical protein